VYGSKCEKNMHGNFVLWHGKLWQFPYCDNMGFVISPILHIDFVVCR